MRLEFRRFDLTLTVRTAGEREGEIQMGGRWPRAERFSFAGSDVADQIRAAVARLDVTPNDIEIPSLPDHETEVMRRLALDLSINELNALPWEEFLATARSAVAAERMVRISRVVPRIAERPMALPMRILLVDLPHGEAILRDVRGVFGSISDAAVDLAMRTGSTALDAIDDLLAPFGWPTVDVLHLGRLPFADDPDRQLSSAIRAGRGSLAWIARAASLWQTRLIVLDAFDKKELALARRLGATLVARGGPGVIVRPGAAAVPRLYSRLIHDFPLDVLDASSFYFGDRLPHLDAVFVGAGREEAVRVSNVGKAVAALIESRDDRAISPTPRRKKLVLKRSPVRTPKRSRLKPSPARRLKRSRLKSSPAPKLRPKPSPAPKPAPKPSRLKRSPARRLKLPREKGVSRAPEMLESALGPPIVPRTELDSLRDASAVTALANFAEKYHRYTFSMHERDGLVPMAAELHSLRSQVRTPSAPIDVAGPFDITPSAPARHVNAALQRDGVRVDPASERLVVDEPYSLRIDLGERDEALPVWGDTRLFEDAFEWTPEMDGVWIDVAVNGVGFAVEGDPVQELWLPRAGTAGPLYFAVRPLSPGVAVLRYTLYYRQNIVQTFRIAALTHGSHALVHGIRKSELAALARALDTPLAGLPRATWIVRREYDTGCLDAIERMPARTVSLVANHVGEKRVITVKGEGFFIDAEAGDLKAYVDDVRTALYDASVKKINEFPDDWPYAFATAASDEAGLKEALSKLALANNEARLKEVLPKLALAGWQLYDRLIPGDARTKLNQADVLGGIGEKIAVAHALLEGVIPWAVMYDRMFADDAPAQVCLAALPQQPNGAPGASTCKSSPACLLQQPGTDPIYVACPLRFWGFRHIIEIPPKQVEESTAAMPPAGAPAVASTTAHTRPRLVAVVNAALKSAGDHLKNLKRLKNRNSATVTWFVEQTPAKVVQAVEDIDLDVVYFFCHARGSSDDPTLKACVEFTDPATKTTRRYTADRFGAVAWKNKPLVFINGCATAAFTPDALAPFIRKFSRDRKAGGIVGTEIPVPEQLANDVASLFLERFLVGEEAGPALLAVRRSLLADRNPLGLAYTLYAMAELTIGDAEQSP